MNLIDILRRILNTKNEIKSIINTDSPVLNNDFSRYSAQTYNYLAKWYNEGYVDGYSDYFYNTLGVRQYPEEPLQYKTSTLVNTSTYDPDTVDGITDIARSNLGFRKDIMAEIAEFASSITEEFETYPEYLRILRTSLYNSGVNDGAEDASAVIGEAEEILNPTATYSTDNIFTLTSTQASAVLWFKVGLNGVETRYSDSVYIRQKNDFRIYYWASIGAGISNNDKNALYIDCSSSSSEEPPVGPDVVEIRPPVIEIVDNKIYIDDVNENKGSIEYCINYDEESAEDNVWVPYSGPITVGDGMENVAARVFNSNTYTDPTVKDIPTTEVVDPDQPPVVLLPPARAEYFYDENTGLVTLTCISEGAEIYYNINGSSESWIEYVGEFSIPSQSIVVLYTRTVLDYGVYGIMGCDYPYRIDTYRVILNPPYITTQDYDGNVYIASNLRSSTLKYAITENKDSEVSEWTYIDSLSYTIPMSKSDNRKWVRAVAIYNGEESEEATLYYDWYDRVNDLPSPEIRFEDNTVFISSPYLVYYTTDDSDPANSSTASQYTGNVAVYGISVVEPMTVKAIAYQVDANNLTHFSDVAILSVSPDEEYEFDGSKEYFTVLGASTISTSSSYTFAYSYDKISWNSFRNSLSGLDTDKKVYLRLAMSSNFSPTEIGTFSFVGDSVIVSGNVGSLFYPYDDYLNNIEGFDKNITSLFEGCSNLVDASGLWIGNTSANISKCFKDCVSLRLAPKRLYYTNIDSNKFESVFEGCTSLLSTSIMNISNVGTGGMKKAFYNCTSLEDINIDFSLSSVGNNALESTFENCTSLNTVKSFVVTSDCNVGKFAFNKCFKNTGSFSTESIELNALTLNEGCYEFMFNESKINSFNNLPSTSLVRQCYWSMFKDCIYLRYFGNMSATSVSVRSCEEMFSGCVALTHAPAILAPNINNAIYCFEKMFYGCSNLNYVKALFLTDPENSNGTYNYTYNWLKNVSDTGTFVQSSDATWFRVGPSAIPTNWVVQGVDSSVGEISSISIYQDRVTITTNSSDAIQYQLNGTEGEWSDYNGPIRMSSNSATVYARCVNSRGVTGEVYSKVVTVNNLPAITINTGNNTFTIINPSNFYSSISYRINESPWIVDGGGVHRIYDGDDGATLEIIGTTSAGVRSDVFSFTLTYIPSVPVPVPVIRFVDDYREENFNKVWIQTNELCNTYYKKSYSASYELYDGEKWELQEGEKYTVYAYNEEISTGRASSVVSIFVYYTQEPVRPEAPTITCENNTVYIDSSVQYSMVFYGFDDTPKSEFIMYSEPIPITESHTVKSFVRFNGADSVITSTWCEYEEPVVGGDYLTFTVLEKSGSDNNISLAFYHSINSMSSKYIYYRLNDDQTWIRAESKYKDFVNYNTTDIPFIQNLSIGDRIQIKGLNNTYCIEDNGTVLQAKFYDFYAKNGNFKVSGNIMSLIYGDDFADKGTFNKNNRYAFSRLFYHSRIKDAHELLLPVTDLTKAWGCYKYMFYEGGVEVAPALPATTLTSDCYYGMFMRCGLTTAPELPATELDRGCYEHMFNGCTNLTTAPELPATTLAAYCYEHMFRGCTSLTTAPALPATTLNNFCYAYMFYGCTSLTTAPVLPATTMLSACYQSMFYGCTSLTTAPELPATVLDTYCYAYMFYECTSLVNVPSTLPATTLAAYCYQYMFYGCTSLITAPELPATQSVSNCYGWMFNECRNLNSIKCLITGNNIGFTGWVYHVASTGTFYKKAGSIWKTGTIDISDGNSIPSGWTVVEV